MKKSAGAKKRNASAHKFSLGLQAAAGYDSNMLNKPTDARGAALNETNIKAGYVYRASPTLKFKLAGKFGSSYRYADSDTRGLKLKVGGKVGTRWQLFGARRGRAFQPNGTLALDISYNGTFTPQLDTAPGVVIDEPCDPSSPDFDPELCAEEENENTLEDEIAAADDDASDDDGDADDDTGDDETAESEDALFEGDALAGAMFTSTPARHLYGAKISFDLEVLRGTTLHLNAKGGIGDIGEQAGKPSADFKALGFGLRAKQNLWAGLLKLQLGYALAYRFYDEKRIGTAPDDFAYVGVGHAIAAGAKLRLFRRLKILGGYTFGIRLVQDAPQQDAQTHQLRLGLQFGLTNKLSLFGENSLLWYKLLEKPAKDRSRYQGLLGLRWLM